MSRGVTTTKKDWLLFVDTNILLNFYRLHDDTSLSLLKRLERLKHQLITTFQVEIEFKKNRLHEIKESIKSLKAPTALIPAFLAEVKTTKEIKRSLANIDQRIKKLNQHTHSILANPSKDRVFKTVERLFNSNRPYSLHERHPEVSSIRHEAWQRFTAGWPPRKASDTSMGDAINWEWILWCIRKSGKDVIIVTQDGDYGTKIGQSIYPNDRLVDEVKGIDKRRKIVLLNRLALALREMQVRVTKREEEEEEQTLANIPSLEPTYSYLGLTAVPFPTSGTLGLPDSSLAGSHYSGLTVDPLTGGFIRSTVGSNVQPNISLIGAAKRI